MKFLSLVTVLFILVILSSCQKDENTESEQAESKPKLIKIVDWEAANWNLDSVPEYIVSYSGDHISSLTGKYDDEITFKYESIDVQEDALGSTYRIIRNRTFGNSHAQDTARYVNATQHTFTRLILKSNIYSGSPVFLGLNEPTSDTLFLFQDLNSGVIPIQVNRDADGDITLLQIYEDMNMEHLRYKVEVEYNSKANKLSALNKDLSYIDPSCRSAEGRLTSDLNANAFPFSIHYGTKCVSNFNVTFYNPITHEPIEFPKHVSYEFNEIGYITKILIDDVAFKEFVYE